jgi:dehydrogenase/reductase SDR family member 12
MNLLDDLLDRSVLGGYTRLGYQLRSRALWPPAAGVGFAGRRVVITGAGGGLGRAAAAAMARGGAELVLLVRDPDRAADTAAALRATGAAVRLVRCDLADLDQVRAAAGEITDRVDVLVHNAGVLPDGRTESPQGHELTLATHVLGPLLLSELLRPVLAGGRVVWVSSGGMYTQKLPADDPEYRSGTYRGATAYARSKRTQVAFTPLLARRWLAERIGVYAMHPGWADTPGVVDSLPGFHRLLGPLLRTPEEGADTVVWLSGVQPAPPTGRFWHDRAVRPAHYLPLTRHTDDELHRMWRYCARAVDVDPA